MNYERMRRKDREMTQDEALAFLKTAAYVYLSTTDPDGMPYCVPVNVYMPDDETLYFHGLAVGHKIDNINQNPHVCITYAESAGTAASSRTKEGFILAFRSVVGFGTVTAVTDMEEKKTMLTDFCKQQVDPALEAYQHIAESVERSAKVTAVYKIHLDTLTGKQNPNPYEDVK